MKYLKTFESKKKQIEDPMINSIVKHTAWRYEDNNNYPCDVYIISGRYKYDGRLSNFWEWCRVLPDGSLDVQEGNYGSFEYSDVVDYKKYTIEEIKEIYPEKYEKYLLKKDAEKFNL